MWSHVAEPYSSAPKTTTIEVTITKNHKLILIGHLLNADKIAGKVA